MTYEPSGDKVVILDRDGTVLTTLNPVGAVIWQASDGRRDVATLARDLVPAVRGRDAGRARSRHPGVRHRARRLAARRDRLSRC
ncbi:MAG: PqqD family protein [Acidimicrobiales bacterium]